MGDARGMPDAEVDALAKEVVDWYIEWNPIFATYVGIHDHDHRLPIGTYDAELEERARVKEFLHRVEAIDRTGLSAGKRVDLGNLRNVFRIWIFEPEEIGTWQSMPRGAQTVGDALFPLFMRSFAPLPRRLDSITGRLERSPGFLEETKGRIRAPIKIWCEISLESAQRVPNFLHVIEATGKEALAGPDRAARGGRCENGCRAPGLREVDRVRRAPEGEGQSRHRSREVPKTRPASRARTDRGGDLRRRQEVSSRKQESARARRERDPTGRLGRGSERDREVRPSRALRGGARVYGEA